MSADNNDTKPSVISNGPVEAPQRDTAQTLLIVLVALALIASVIMLFTGSVGAMKIALLAALWAAVIGAFLAFRYRNQIETTRNELNNERAQHSLEMQEAKARFDADQAKMERDITERVTEKVRKEDNETLGEIRAQLEQMRNQLEYLTGQSYAEPSMIHAQARRIPEIEAEEKKSAPKPADVEPETVTGEPVTDQPAQPQQAEQKQAEAVAQEEKAAPIFGVGKPQKPEAKPEAKPEPKPETKNKAEAKNYATPAGAAKNSIKSTKPAQEEKQSGPAIDETQTFARVDVESSEPAAGGRRSVENKTFDTNTFEAVNWVQGGTAKSSTTEKADKPYIGKRSAEAKAAREAAAAASHGKRRRDEHTQALSVADLLKRNKKDK